MSLIVIEMGRGGTMTAMRAEETATEIAMTTGIAGIMTEEVCHSVCFNHVTRVHFCVLPFPSPKTSRL